MSSGKKITVIILSVLIALTLCFIFRNSFLGKESSSTEARGVLETLSPILDAIFGEGVITIKFFRKAAHFAEFFLLGLEVCFLMFTLKGLKLKPFLCVLPAGFFVGGIDEIIQIFSERGALFTDVLIDFSGYVAAFIPFAIAFVIKHLKSKKIKKT